MRPFYLFSLILFMFSGAFGQDCPFSISGNVTDEHDKTPLQNAAISIKGTSTGVFSDSLGNYIITNLCPGTYTLVVQHLDCNDVERTIEVRENTKADFILEHHEQELQEIVVRSKQLLHETPTQASEQLKGDQYDAVADESLGRLLEKIVGVTVLETGPGISKPVIQGITGSRIMMISNGVRLESQQWGSEHAPEMDPFASTSVTVVKGAGAIRYGTDALGGTVLVEPSPLPVTKGIKGENFAVFRSNGLHWVQSHILEGGGSDGFGWRLQGSYKRGGDQKAPNYNLTNTGIQEGGASASIGYRKFRYGIDVSYNFYHSNVGLLRSAHIGNIPDLALALERDTPLIVEPFSYKIGYPSQEVDHHMARVNGFYRIKDKLKLSLQYAVQYNHRKEFDIRRGERSDIPTLDLQLASHFFEVVLEHQELKNWTGSSGISMMHQYNYNFPGTGVRPLIPDFSGQVAAIYHLQKYAKEKWEVEAGFRYEYRHLLVKRIDRDNNLVKPVHNYHNIAFTTGGIYKPNEFFNLKINAGGYSRAPQTNELYSEGLHHGAAAIEYGDPDLGPERGFKLILSLEGKVRERFDWSMSPHIARVRNYIYLVADSVPELTVRGAFPVFRYTQTTALIGGFDMQVAGKPHRDLTLGVKASIVRGRDVDRDQWLIYIPADRVEPFASFSKKIDNHSFSIDTRFPYVFEQKRYEAALDIAAPPSGYFLWDMQLSYGISLAKVKVQTTLAAENILDVSYRDYLNRLRYYADNPGRNITVKFHVSY